MHIAQVTFPTGPESDPDAALDALSRLLGALRMNGQILGREHPLAKVEEGFRTFLMLPAVDALEERHARRWVVDALARVSQAGLQRPAVQIIGEAPDARTACTCSSRGSLILFTTYLSLESCLRCGECFGPLPLYSVPPTADDEYHDVMSWQSDYQACDGLQMNCRTGERFGYREISWVDSSLSRQGLAICRKIEGSTGLPVYYYLHRYYGRNLQTERKRLCPGCGGQWLLAEPLHDLFDFQCTSCQLLSCLAPVS